MSVSSAVRKAGPFTGNGVTTAFPFLFKVFQASDLLVVQTDTTPLDTTLVLNTHYTVARNANQDANPGGTVNMITAPPSGYLLTIGSSIPASQSVVLTNNGGWYPSVVNDALDYLTILTQQISEKIGRSLILPFSTSSSVSAQLPPVAPGQLLGWNGQGTGIANMGTAGTGSDALLNLVSVGGTANAITGTTASALAMSSNQFLLFTPTAANTGGVTVNRDSLGAKPVLLKGAALTGGEFQPNVPVLLEFDGNNYNIVAGSAAIVTVADGSGGSLWTNVAGFVAKIISSAGSSVVGFIQAGTGAVARWVQDKLRERVSVFDFLTAAQIADVQSATPALDLSTPLANFQAFIAANNTRYKGVFPSGIYRASAFPNWASNDTTYEAEGQVFMRYTGTGNALVFDGGASTGNVFNFKWLGNFIVQAPSTALNGYFVRSVHHSKIEGRVDGCGTSSAALLINFAVCSEFNVKTSANELYGAGWYSAGHPLNGIVATRRGVNENCSANTFRNPIVEGVSGDGIHLDYAINNQFLGGTSESNTGFGISTTGNSWANLIQGLDMESNTAGDVSENGSDNVYKKVYSTSTITIASGVHGTKIEDGQVNSVIDNGTATILDGFRYGINSGTITGSPVSQTRRAIVNAINNTPIADLTAGSMQSTTASVPNNTATTVLTLPSTGNNSYHVIVYVGGTGAASLYTAYALIAQDGASSVVMLSHNGTNITITLSGQNIQVTQTSGAAQTVYAKATII